MSLWEALMVAIEGEAGLYMLNRMRILIHLLILDLLKITEQSVVKMEGVQNVMGQRETI